jgi:two-component sensor histidine kinase
VTLDKRACDLWGVSAKGRMTFETLSAKIHPQDLDRVRTAFTATRGLGYSYEVDFRILLDELVRWVSARGKGDDENIRAGVMFGIFLDVTQRKLAEEAHELIAGEMSHRVKNLLAVASALTQITSRAATTQEMAKDLTNRLITLGRVHTWLTMRSRTIHSSSTTRATRATGSAHMVPPSCKRGAHPGFCF